MKRFRFALAGVQRWREHEETAARRELGTRTRRVADLDARLAAVTSHLEDCRTDRHGSALAGALEAGLSTLRQRLTRERDEAESDLELARAVYAEKHRESETIRKLKQSRLEDWRREVAKAEQAELDELARIRFARGGRT